MPTVDVVDLNNQKVGELELADEVFGTEVNNHLLYEAVRHYQAGQRAGTHKTKVRGDVAGSGKKLWKQKGTGRARVGSVRSPIWPMGMCTMSAGTGASAVSQSSRTSRRVMSAPPVRRSRNSRGVMSLTIRTRTFVRQWR